MHKLALWMGMALVTACGGAPAPAPVAPAPVASATGVLRVGLVVDGEPLARAFVTVGDKTEVLDGEGKARFELPAGVYEGRVASAGIHEVRFKATVVAGKETIQNMRASSVNTKDAN